MPKRIVRCDKNQSGRYELARSALIGLCVAGAITACTSGDGGDNGHSNPGGGGGVVNPGKPGGLTFSYPVNGQQDVFTQTQIALAFAGPVDSGSNQLTLVANPGTSKAQTVATDVVQDDKQPGIFRLQVASGADVERSMLQPNTRYAVQATGKIGSGNTVFNKGDTLFTFTTRALDGRPAESFKVVNQQSIGNTAVPFTVFNPIRARFTEPVEEGSVKLCTGNEKLGDQGCSIAVTGPDGNVPGRLTLLGQYMTFDPDDGSDGKTSQDPSVYTGDLKAGTQYKVAFSDQLKSAFGESLSGAKAFTVTPVSVGKSVVQNLKITPTSASGDLPDNQLNGQKVNFADIKSRLIGSNKQPALNTADRGGLLARLAQPSDSDRYKGLYPNLLPAGQQFDLTPLDLKLEGIATPVKTGNIKVRFINDADVYIASNNLRNVASPTRVYLRFDLGISTDVGQNDPIKSLGNGVFNQTAMNIVASGMAIPQSNGDLKITSLGSFPVAVNRTGNAIVDFELELTLPAGEQKDKTQPDSIAPTIVAQYPSSCLYTFSTQGFKNGEVLSGAPGTTTISDVERGCIDVLNKRMPYPTYENLIQDDPLANPNPDSKYVFAQPWSDSFPIDASPSIVFSEPVNPATLDGNILLSAQDESGKIVSTHLRTEGSTVVVSPAQPLQPNTKYTLTVNNQVADLAGNNLQGQFPDSNLVSDITFTTEPMVVPTDNAGHPSTLEPDDVEAVHQAAPFLTLLTPGMPCALDADSGDFKNGGDKAGNCVGDQPSQVGTLYPGNPFFNVPDTTSPASPKRIYPVFKSPSNNAVEAYFSKPVKSSTIKAANGCLIGGTGNTNRDATFAVQKMDGNGNCEGAVKGKIAYLTTQGDLTDGFTFRPSQPFIEGQRYWIVVCGGPDANGQGSSNCSTGKTIVGQSGFALNTDPLKGTGSKVVGTTSGGSNSNFPKCGVGVPTTSDSDSVLAGLVECFDKTRGLGGPDIVMPFDATAPTKDFYAATLALPKTDTNGNGLFDNSPYFPDALDVENPGKVFAGFNSGEDRQRLSPIFNESLGRERAQLSNVVFSKTVDSLTPIFAPVAPREGGFLGGARPIAIRPAESGASCQVSNVSFDDGTAVIGNGTPSSCIPIDLLSGGITTITSLPGIYLVPTGRVLLRFPGNVDDDGNVTELQRGFIVPECKGQFKGGAKDGQSYDYSPCFIANLDLTVSAPDNADSLMLLQQDLNVSVFGPVAFEQNGRLVISTRNANSFSIIAKQNGTNVPLNASTVPGEQTLQLVGPAIHGGRSFPVR